MKEDTFRWTHVQTKDEVEKFYRSILPAIRVTARAHGYAIGVHGSLRRDLDLIAVPWTERRADKDQLAGAIQRAACGIQNSKFTWERKPLGRVATSFPVCWPEWNEPSAGHIDLSVMGGESVSEG